jgi:protein-S-isoprenylcysteine O-methyltransferase Ste14
MDTARQQQHNLAIAHSGRDFGVGLVLASLFASFAYTHLVAFISSPYKISLLLFAFSESIIVFLFLSRKQTVRVTKRPLGWIVAIVGTFVVLFLRPSSETSVIIIGEIFVIVGVSMQIVSLLSLGRSFGLVPTVRGIKTTGLYTYIRHPMYASYLPLFTGYAITNPTPQNITILCIAMACLLVRVNEEEKILSTEKTYQQYMHTVRWRLIPKIY